MTTGAASGAAADPFDTAALRDHVLAAWTAAPARFRADANAEEDAAGAGYRDRLVVELLQNAADSAAERSASLERGRTRVLFRLRDDLLEIANTGAPLHAGGVEGLATLRASAKRGARSVGHFGVGFTAVLAVSDEPALVSRATGGVQFSRRRTQQEVAAIPALRRELDRRRGAVPVLRLPWPLGDEALAPPDGYDTVVRLPLRDVELARRLLAEVDPSLLLVLPRVEEIVIEVDGRRRLLRCEWAGPGPAPDATVIEEVGGEVRAHSSWAGAVRRGRLPAEVLADRPVEERARETYEVRAFALRPVGEAAAAAPWPPDVPRRVRAPQPTDEALDLPVVLAAPFPLEAMRRHVVPGPLLDLMIAQSAAALLAVGERLTRQGAVVEALSVVPTGLPGGPVDARLRDALLPLLGEARLLPGRRRGRDCALLDVIGLGDDAVEVLGEVIDGVLPAALAAPSWRSVLTALGVRRLTAADVVEAVSGQDQPASWWARLYAALRNVPDRDALGALPVPLADGRRVTGPRGVLLPDPGLPGRALSGLPLRIADPAACTGPARDVLLQLGALDAGPRAMLADPAVVAALDDELPDLADAVLELVAAAGLAPGELPALARLLLPDDSSDPPGEPTPAEELVLPGGPLAGVLRPDAPFGTAPADLVQRWGSSVLEAVGVLRTFAILRATDVVLEPDEPTLLDLDASDRWLRDLADAGDRAPALDTFVAVRDLEWVAPQQWPQAFAELSRGALREAVLASPYTQWWLRSFARLPAVTGEWLPPSALRFADGDPDLLGCYDELDGQVAAALDRAVLRAAGIVDDFPADLPGWQDLLDRIGEPAGRLSWQQACSLYRRLGAVAGERLDDLAPPDRLRTMDGVREAANVVVVDAPDLLPLLGPRGRLPVPAQEAPGIAALLDLPLASELAGFAVVSDGRPDAGTDDAVRALLAAPLPVILMHDELRVRNVDGKPVRVPWRVDRDRGQVHVARAAGADALGRALAWWQGRWPERHVITAALRDSRRAAQLTEEAAFDR